MLGFCTVNNWGGILIPFRRLASNNAVPMAQNPSGIISDLRPAARNILTQHILMHQGAKPLFRATVLHLIDCGLDFNAIRGLLSLDGD